MMNLNTVFTRPLNKVMLTPLSIKMDYAGVQTKSLQVTNQLQPPYRAQKEGMSGKELRERGGIK